MNGLNRVLDRVYCKIAALAGLGPGKGEAGDEGFELSDQFGAHDHLFLGGGILVAVPPCIDGCLDARRNLLDGVNDGGYVLHVIVRLAH